MKSAIKFLIFLLPVLALGATSEAKNYDIVERILNFLLFFGILLYFIAKPLKDMYLGRIKGIADKLENIQEKLRLSKSKKDEALRRVEEAKVNAASLVETAKKEAVILSQKVKKESETELANLDRSFAEQKEFEERKMTKAVVSEVLSEIFDDKGLNMDKKELVNIILKKVS